MKAAGGRPSVRYYEGKEGLRAIRQEIIMYTDSGDTILNFTPMDHLHATFAVDNDVFFRQRVAKKIFAKTLFSTRSHKLREKIIAGAKPALSEYRYVPPTLFPSISGLTIYKDRVAIASFAGNQMGVIIESSSMADMMRCIFTLAWTGAECLEKQEK